MRRVNGFLILLSCAVIVSACMKSQRAADAAGPYLGQSLPGEQARLFAPGIVSTALYERDLTMSPDGNEIYFGVVLGNHSHATICVVRRQGNVWSEPEVAPFCTDPEVKSIEPHITPDGKRFLFASNRGKANERDFDIWIMDRTGTGWSEPVNAGAPVNTEAGEFFPSVTQDGTLYFTRGEGNGLDAIYRSRLVNGRYTEPERLPEAVNAGRSRYNAFAAPDESYLIVPVFGHPDSEGGTDYFVVFRSENDEWNGPHHLGPPVSSASPHEWSASVSPDGKFLFFMSARQSEDSAFHRQPLTLKRMHEKQCGPENGNPDIYWMDAGFITALRDSLRL